MKGFAFVLLLTVTGCAGGQWVHPAKTAEDFERDKFDCENVIVTKYGGWANVEPFTASLDIRRCLQSKGYQRAG